MKANGFVPSCSVIICTRNRPKQVKQCLEAMSRLDYPAFEVVVVDNAPSDLRTRQLAEMWAVRYIVEPIPGLDRARNMGAQACTTEIVAYLDDDAIPEPGWLSGLVQEFKDPLVMAVTGQIRASRVETEAERLCAMIGGTKIGGEERRVVDSATPNWFEMANFGGIGDGGNMAFRHNAFKVWPGFHERLDSGVVLDGCGEHYAFFKLIDLGYRVAYTPHAVVLHPFPATMGFFLARYLKDLANATGYMTLLLYEEPKYRRETMKYLVEGIRGTKRTWRAQVINPLPRHIIPRWRVLLGYLTGPFLYVWSRLSKRPLIVEKLDSWRILDLNERELNKSEERNS